MNFLSENMSIEFIKVKIANTEVEVPIFINRQKTEEIIKKIEDRMNELTKYYQVTRTQTFALRIAYECLMTLEEEREKIKRKEKEIEEQYKIATQKIEEIIQKIESQIEKE